MKNTVYDVSYYIGISKLNITYREKWRELALWSFSNH